MNADTNSSSVQIWKITSSGIKYVDIRYADSRLGDPSIMKNIDYYLRNLLTQNLSALP